jgi:hypothetical protein
MQMFYQRSIGTVLSIRLMMETSVDVPIEAVTAITHVHCRNIEDVWALSRNYGYGHGGLFTA